MARFGVFNFDSPLWKFLGRIFDAFWLTVLWCIFSLPVITVGASTVAVYTVALRMMRDEESSSITKQFFVAFKDNILQGIISTFIVGIIGAVIYLGFKNIMLITDEISQVFVIAMIILSFVFIMIVKFLFPVIARFSNSLGNLLVIAIIISIKNFGWTLLLVTISVCYFLIAIFKFWPLLLFSIGAIALFDSWIINNLFSTYIKENNIQ